MKRCAMVRDRSTRSERTCPCRSPRILSLPANVHDHEYCPVSTHFASSASHALQRLRELIGDPLLVRAGARMELTLRAQALRSPLAEVLDQVRGLFIPDDFDAARSERQFRLMMPDLAVELLMPLLMEKITRLAPNVRIEIVPWRGPAIFNTEFARTVDLVISIGNAFKGFHRQPLYTDS